MLGQRKLGDSMLGFRALVQAGTEEAWRLRAANHDTLYHLTELEVVRRGFRIQWTGARRLKVLTYRGRPLKAGTEGVRRLRIGTERGFVTTATYF